MSTIPACRRGRPRTSRPVGRPTPRVPIEEWEFTISTESGQRQAWDWAALTALPTEEITVDPTGDEARHLEGVSLDTLFADVETAADYALVHSYGGYTTNLPVDDLLEGKAWIAFATTARIRPRPWRAGTLVGSAPLPGRARSGCEVSR